jgi:hypothetical protein
MATQKSPCWKIIRRIHWIVERLIQILTGDDLI